MLFQLCSKPSIKEASDWTFSGYFGGGSFFAWCWMPPTPCTWETIAFSGPVTLHLQWDLTYHIQKCNLHKRISFSMFKFSQFSGFFDCSFYGPGQAFCSLASTAGLPIRGILVITLPDIWSSLPQWTFLSSPGHYHFPFLFPLKININNQGRRIHFTINKHASSARNIKSYPFSLSVFSHFHFIAKHLTVPLNPFGNFLL